MTRILLTISVIFMLTPNAFGQAHDQILEAHALYENKQFSEAGEAFAALAKENPVKGEYSYKLGLIHKKQGRPAQSIKYFQDAMAVGYRTPYCIYHIAVNYSKLGDYDQALRWIKEGLSTPKSITYEQLVSDDALEGFRNSDFFNEVYPSIPEGLDRNSKWNADIAFLRRGIRNSYYQLSEDIASYKWAIELSELKETVPHLSDTEIVAKLFKIVASLGDGHTFVRPPLAGDMAFHHFPIGVYHFKEGVHIIAAAEQYNQWVGAQLIAIENRPTEGILTSLEDYISVDNKMGYKQNINFMMLPEMLQELGVDIQNNSVSLKINKDGKESEISVKATDFNPQVWTSLPVSKNTEPPLWATRSNELYWFEELPGANAVYMHINFNYSAGPYDIEAFYDSTFQHMREKNIERLVIDLRNCPGGNSFTNKRLIQNILSMPQLNKKGNLFTITGRKTFSAAMNLSTDLEYWTATIFIGEPTGSSPNFIGETNFITLPNSKINVSISNAYWQRSTSWDHRKWIAPDIYKAPTIDDFNLGQDTVLDYILSYWAK